MKKLVILAVLLLAACDATIPVENGPPIEVLFCEREDCAGLLVALLEDADDAKCAMYSVSLPAVKEALDRVEWITDDDRGALMHNKFCVFDKNTVWTGSWNPTKTKQANNVVIIQSTVLADNYLDEFDELPGGPWRVRRPQLIYNNRLIENYFCPEDDCKEHVLAQLSSAQQSIRFMLSWVTDEDIIATLNERRNDIDVQGVLDNGIKSAQEQLPFTTIADVHHKVFIIDGETVITGSYNPTKAGNERNDENILIIHDRSVAQQYLAEYDYVQQN